ncbi:MAG TPA: GNAT family N-acetyltransferase [Thermoanaerobaculia bacterium]|nr:GNAT family N-acetyltransferase [Thermoanaerobaculia bacterium]
MDPNIRRLGPEHAAALASLRREALESHPLAFGASLEDDRCSPDFFRTSLANPEEQAVFGCFEGTGLAGMVGVRRETAVKRRHRAQVWGMYVAPRARQKGAGSALLQAAIEQARSWPGVVQVHLSVTEPAVAAQRLYEAVGFRTWGHEPRALQWEGSFVDESHLVRDLA